MNRDNDFIDSLRKWGCDVDDALERLCEDSEFYYKCIKLFEDDAAFSKIKESIETKQYSDALEAAYMLKGVAANLGLSPLHDSISAFVEDLRDEKYDRIDALYGDVNAQYSELKNLIE